MKKTCILFGAGAETMFGLPSGKKFATDVVGLDGNVYKEAIQKFYKSIKDDKWYPQYRDKVVNEMDKLYEASYKKKRMVLRDYDISTKKKFDQFVSDEVKKLSEEQRKKLLDDYPSYMGILDEEFHTIIYPKALGPHKFWGVIGCYWRAYLSIVSKLIQSDEYLKIMESPKESYEKMCKVARGDKLYNIDSYYKCLRKYIDSNPISIITTNYTPLCEEIAELSRLKKDSIAYANGSFKWFEQAKEMNILDVDINNKEDFANKDYFPFIFLQSGVKPIVCSRQVKEYWKMVNSLENCERLIILGYRANCDDNHINSMIREFILKDGEKEVIYFSFNEKLEKNGLLNRFAINSSKQDELRNANIIINEINEKNGIENFEKVLSS